jgi:hypothetical protein
MSHVLPLKAYLCSIEYRNEYTAVDQRERNRLDLFHISKQKDGEQNHSSINCFPTGGEVVVFAVVEQADSVSTSTWLCEAFVDQSVRLGKFLAPSVKNTFRRESGDPSLIAKFLVSFQRLDHRRISSVATSITKNHGKSIFVILDVRNVNGLGRVTWLPNYF